MVSLIRYWESWCLSIGALYAMIRKEIGDLGIIVFKLEKQFYVSIQIIKGKRVIIIKTKRSLFLLSTCCRSNSLHIVFLIPWRYCHCHVSRCEMVILSNWGLCSSSWRFSQQTTWLQSVCYSEPLRCSSANIYSEYTL